uniref:FH2 domain-containing protein n=1 Tax=Parastrongyloides trichosuri TaxID=131310 RepID=A0A0N5A235_PARTI
MILANDPLSLQTRFSPTANNQIKLEPSSSTSSSASPTSDSEDITNVSSPMQQSTSTQEMESVSPKSESFHSGTTGESCSPRQIPNKTIENNINNSKFENINTISPPLNPAMDFSALLNSINRKEQSWEHKNTTKRENSNVEMGNVSTSVNIQDMIPKLPIIDNTQNGNFINTFTQGDPNAILQLSQLLTNNGNSNIFSNTTFSNFGRQLNNENIQNNKRLSQGSILTSNTQPTNGNEKKRSYPYTFQYCVLCQKNVHSSKLPCHIRQCHVAKPMFRCPSCDFTSTYSKNNVKSHMVSLHGLAGDPISYMDQYSSQVEEYMKKCFPNVRGRGRPVHGRNSPKSPHAKKQQIQPPISLIPEQGNISHLTAANISGQMNQFNMMYNPMFNKNINPSFAAALNTHNHFSNTQIPVSTGQMNTSSFPPPSGNWTSLPLMNGADKNYASVMMHSNPLNIFPYINNTIPKTESSIVNIQDSNKIEFHNINENLSKVGKQNENISPFLNINNMTELLSNFKRKTPEESVVECKKENNNNKKLKKILIDDELLKPKYFGMYAYNTFKLLDNSDIKDTVFETSINYYQKIKEKLFNSKKELFKCKYQAEGLLLSLEEQSKIDEIKKRLKAQPFEILFALHKYDISVLSAEDISLIASIAPTTTDIKKIKQLTQSHKSSLTESESFITQLASIENLPKKIYTMNFIFNKFSKLSYDALTHYKRISSLVGQLSHNNALKEIFNIILILFNMFYSYENECLNNNNIGKENFLNINGFTFETFENILLLGGDIPLFEKKNDDLQVNDTFKNIVKSIFNEIIDKEKIGEILGILNEILKIDFDCNEKIITSINEGLLLLENEKDFMSDKSKEIVAEFTEVCRQKMVDINNERIEAKKNIDTCLNFYCANINYETNNFPSNTFFVKLNDILKNLNSAF